MLLSLRFVTGLFGGTIGALALSVISDVFPFKRRGKAMGTLMAGFSAAAALGVPVGLYLADLYSWRVPFYLVGSMGVILWIFIALFFPSMTDHLATVNRNRSMRRILTMIFSDKNQRAALILGMTLVLGHFVIVPFIAPYMIRNVGFTAREISYVYLIGGILTVFSSPFFGRMTDRYGVIKVFRILMFISFIPVIAITNMPPVAIWIALIATSVFFVFGSGRMIPPQTLITASVGPDNRGSFMSIKSAVQQLSVAAASYISGYIVIFDDAGDTLLRYDWVGYLSIAICLVALYLVTRINVAAGN